MKIGIMGAMPEEINSIKHLMSDITEIQHGSRQYFTGKINNTDVVLVFSRIGKVAASATATSLITEFNVNQIIFTGVAGAVSKTLAIGDIVISDNLYQHDVDASPLFPKYEIPLTGKTFFTTDATLKEKARQAAESLLTSIGEKIDPETLRAFNIDQPQCLVGTIATGDQFIKSQEATQAIAKDHPDTLAVEMESAAVAQVCQEYNTPFVIIRTISDKADHSAHIDFPRFIAEIASVYAEHIIAHLFEIPLTARR